MNQFKRCSVVLLPTNQKVIKGDLLKRHIWKGTKNECNSLWKFNEEIVIDNIKQYTTLNSSFRDVISLFEPQYLYITSDEEIKENSLVLLPNNTIHRMNASDMISYLDSQSKATKHIIATTQPFMNLPQPSNQFIEKYIEEYNKGSVITDVLVEYIDNGEEGWSGSNEDGEPIWNEKIELKVNPKDNTITIKKVKESWNKEELLNTVNYWFEEPDTNIILNKINNWVISNL